MSFLVCIESSTEVCSVAVARNGETIDCLESVEGPNHARLLTGYIEQLYHRNNLYKHKPSAVAVSMGPGSYTGLRIGVSAAKGLCFASDIPLIAVCPLQSMSSFVVRNQKRWGIELQKPDILIPMIDARRMEVYTAMFDPELNAMAQVDAKVIDSGSFRHELENHRCFFFGNGAAKCRTSIDHDNALFLDGVHASAAHMVQVPGQSLGKPTLWMLLILSHSTLRILRQQHQRILFWANGYKRLPVRNTDKARQPNKSFNILLFLKD